jgi:hypothetical protein
MSDELSASSEPDRTFVWAAEPEMPDWSVLKATGRHWEEWVALIDAGPGREAGHTAIAAWVHEFDPQLTGWWAQGVAVGYERIAGLRLPGQMPDGTFTVSRSRLLTLDVDAFRARLLNDTERASVIPGLATASRSKAASKSLRFTLTGAADQQPLGILMLTFDPAADGRVRVTATHEKLPAFEVTEAWKERWADWLAAL